MAGMGLYSLHCFLVKRTKPMNSSPPLAILKGGRLFTAAALAFSLGLFLLAWLGGTDAIIQRLAIIQLVAVYVAALLTPPVIRLAVRLGAVDMPGGRRIHVHPTPRWGGVALWAGVVTALLVTSMHYMPNLKAMLIASSIIMYVGLLDDLMSVNAAVKLFCQLAACAILIADGLHVTFLPDTWWGMAGEWIITVIWIVGITNAINFLDGMDGLVTGLAIGTGLIFYILSILLGEVMMAYCAIALVGAAVGFLGFNIKPARIFLGDSGSNLIGFFIATLSIMGEWSKSDPLVSFFIPVLILSVPIYDMIFITVARIRRGDVNSVRSWLEYVGRDHLHHRLEGLGLTRGQVVVTICFLNMAVGLGSVTLLEARTYGGVALIVSAICIYLVVALLEVLGEKRIAAGKKEG